MAKSRDSDNAKSKKMGRPVSTGTGELIGVRILPDLLGAVDRWKTKSGCESRPEAIRKILTEHLKKR
jgi:hypothetical protein